jgi:uncharacterized repeat protein (TIGR03803 family)
VLVPCPRCGKPGHPCYTLPRRCGLDSPFLPGPALEVRYRHARKAILLRSEVSFHDPLSVLAGACNCYPASAGAEVQGAAYFHGAPNDGAFPWTQLIRDAHGNLYGTTEEGGNGKGVCVSFFGGCGTSFKLDGNGKRIWQHSFNSTKGTGPMAGLLRDKAGNLYGTTTLGGDTNCFQYGCGTVFRLDKTGKETVLHKFHGTPDGQFPEALLVKDDAGNLYGTAYMGGKYGFGEVFRLDKTGKETILHSFAGPLGGGGDGAYPYPGVILDATGNLFGVTGAGGASGGGTVYKVDVSGGETLLHSFAGADGDGPNSVLAVDLAGNLYGTTQAGGNSGCTGGSGCGVVFKLLRHGETWTETVLYVFCSLSNCADGQRPDMGPLVMDSSGNLYGTTIFGGTSSNCSGEGCGVVFKLGPNGKETVLHSFTGGADGGIPTIGVIIDKSGNLYGATAGGGDLNCAIGGDQGCGVVFRLTP